MSTKTTTKTTTSKTSNKKETKTTAKTIKTATQKTVIEGESTQAKTAAPPKTTAKTSASKTPETKTTGSSKPATTKAQAEGDLTIGEILWDLAPDSLNWEEKTDWMHYWWDYWNFHQTSANAGRLVGRTDLYGEAAARLSMKGYRVRRQSGLGRSWLYVTRPQ